MRQACEHFEKFHELCRDRDWSTADVTTPTTVVAGAGAGPTGAGGVTPAGTADDAPSTTTLYTESCRQLALIYSQIGEKYYSSSSASPTCTVGHTPVPSSAAGRTHTEDGGDGGEGSFDSIDTPLDDDDLEEPRESDVNMFHEFLVKSYDKAVEGFSIVVVSLIYHSILVIIA